MKKIKIITALLFSVFAVLAKSQDTMKISLEEAVNLGIQNSKNLQIDEAKIKESTAYYLEARNRKLPGLAMSGSALALANADVDLKIAPSEQSGNAVPKAHSAFYGSINASLPIFAGGKIKYGIKSAEFLVEAAKLNKENDKTKIAFNISKAYNNLFKSGQAIKVLEENLKTSQKRDETFLKLEENGVMARNDRLKANLQTSNIELQLLDAQNNYSIATINMNLLLGLPEKTVLETDNHYIFLQADEKPVAYYVEKAFHDRKDFQALDYQKKASAAEIKSAKGETFPTIALTGGYVAADIPNILTVTNAANIGIGIQYNLDNFWKKNSSLLIAEAKEQQINASGDLMSDQIKLEVNSNYQNKEYYNKRLDVFHKTLLQASENYRIVSRKYDNGLANITDLLDANAAQIVAQIEEINAKADAVLAFKKLLQSTGSLNEE